MASASVTLTVLAALLFWAVNTIQIVQYVQQSQRWKNGDFESYAQLLPASIEVDWVFKIDTKALEYSIGYVKAAFWLVFTLPMIEMAWILSKRGTRSLGCNVGIAFFTLAGSWSKWFATILWTGMYISLIMLADNFNLDNWLSSEIANSVGIQDEDGLGWRVLEVNHTFFRGMTLIIDAIEWFILCVIFFLVFFSVREWRKEDITTFGGRWNALGLFLALLCGIQFILEVVGVFGVQMSWTFFILYAVLFRLLLFPLWIIIMGCQLSKASTKELDSVDTHELQLSEVQNFTIDEDDEPVVPPTPPGPSSPPAEAFASLSEDNALT